LEKIVRKPQAGDFLDSHSGGGRSRCHCSCSRKSRSSRWLPHGNL